MVRVPIVSLVLAARTSFYFEYVSFPCQELPEKDAEAMGPVKWFGVLLLLFAQSCSV